MCQHYKENWTVLKVQRSLKAVHIGLMQLVMSFEIPLSAITGQKREATWLNNRPILLENLTPVFRSVLHHAAFKESFGVDALWEALNALLWESVILWFGFWPQ